MGEIRGGEGSGQSPRADQLAAAIAADFMAEGPDIETVTVQYVTSNLWAVSVLERGQHEPERFFMSADGVRTEQ